MSLSYLLTRGVLSSAFFSYGVTDIDALITGPSPVCDSSLSQATDHPNSEISSSSMVSVWLGVHLRAQGLTFAVSFQLVDASPATATEMNRFQSVLQVLLTSLAPLCLRETARIAPSPCFLFRCRKIIDGGVGLKQTQNGSS